MGTHRALLGALRPLNSQANTQTFTGRLRWHGGEVNASCPRLLASCGCQRGQGVTRESEIPKDLQHAFLASPRERNTHFWVPPNLGHISPRSHATIRIACSGFQSERVRPSTASWCPHLCVCLNNTNECQVADAELATSRALVSCELFIETVQCLAMFCWWTAMERCVSSFVKTCFGYPEQRNASADGASGPSSHGVPLSKPCSSTPCARTKWRTGRG